MKRLLGNPDIKCVDVDGCDFKMQTSDSVRSHKETVANRHLLP